MHMNRLLTTALLVASTAAASFGAPIDEARQLVKEGDFRGARKQLEQALEANPKIAASAEYNYLLGVCEFDTGNYDNARCLLQTARAKKYGLANLFLGRLAFLDYDFDTATDFYDDFRTYRDKLGQVAGEDVEESERELAIAESAITRVENVAVIDSLSVPKDKFFEYYRLPKSAGKLLPPDAIPFKESSQGAVMAYATEAGDYMIWGEPDSIGNAHLVESLRLLDGTWQEPKPVADHFSNKYADYPFMMPDGVTLYFASDGEGTMGGYDIFVATRDATTGEYLQPQNIGMPFNSPYDDYMLAIDEDNGIGWWATDRNRQGDNVTVYVYSVNDIRKNYDPDDENVASFARLSDYKATWNPADSEIYERKLAAIEGMENPSPEKKIDFNFPIGNGEYYHSISDFKNRAAFDAMNAYLKAADELGDKEQLLDRLRRRYPMSRADNLREEITALEHDIELKRTELTKLKSNVYRCLKGEK